MEREHVIRCIEKAFSGVELGDGIGLREAQGIEDELDLDSLRRIRDLDEKHAWDKISIESLNACETSLHFFNANGMRFHLPAYLIAEINQQSHQKILFHLTNSSNRGQGRFATLNIGQRRAVIKFLKWCLDQDCYQQQRLQIKQAMECKWRNAVEVSEGKNLKADYSIKYRT